MQQLFEIRAARDTARDVSAVGTTTTPAVAAIAAAATTGRLGQLTAVNPGNTSQRGVNS
jgi:hypothetical protein